VFMIPTEFRILEHNVATMSQGAESAMFKKPEKEGKHMKPLFIKGHLKGKPMGRMMVDGGASISIMLLSCPKSSQSAAKLCRRLSSWWMRRGDIMYS
jgi:hypothetical protein